MHVFVGILSEFTYWSGLLYILSQQPIDDDELEDDGVDFVMQEKMWWLREKI